MEDCKICLTQDLYSALLENGIDETRAFHLAVEVLLEDVIEDAVERSFELGKTFGFEAGIEQGYETAYEKGYEDGYKEACGDLAEIVGAYADSVED